jgi:ribosome biogenesis GTPase
MSLTRRQKWRIEKVQSERIARANKAVIEAEKNITNEEMSQKGLVITRYGHRQLVESSTGELFQCTGRQNLGLSVAGDEVIFQPVGVTEGIVTAILPRGNELTQKNKLIATNIDQLWLVVATEPHYQFELIDRYLILAENSNLPINIIVNKIELVDELDQLSKDFSLYQDINYQVHFISIKKQLNLKSLQDQLINKTNIFLGQSGVGKSSLINSLIPDLELRVNEISSKSKRGKHTTTNTTIYHIPSGGDLIDSPGIREFQLDDFDAKQILNGFREFKPLIGKCRFRNCQHINEPDCAIKVALDAGDIYPSRYENYLNLLPE